MYCTHTHNIHTTANTHTLHIQDYTHTHKYTFEQKLTVAERDGGKPLYRSKKSSSVVTSRNAEKDNNQNNEKAGRQYYCWLTEVWLNTVNRTNGPWSRVMEARQPDWDTTAWSMVWLRHHWLKKYSSTQLRKQDNLTKTQLAIKQSHKIATRSRQQQLTKLKPSSHKDRTLPIFCCWSCQFLLLVFSHQKNYSLHN